MSLLGLSRIQFLGRVCAAAGLIVMALPGLAQSQVTPAQRPIAVPDYVSPLGKYQRYTPAPSPQWVKANETVYQIGGWRVYSREQASKTEAQKQ